MQYQTIINLLDTTSDNVPKFITKKWIEVHDQSGKVYITNKQIRFNTSTLQSDLCDYSDAYIVVKQTINVTGPIMMHMTRNWLLKIIRHLLDAFQKLITHLLIMKKI